MSNHGISNIKQHEEYYLRDGNICFVVEATMFRLHRHFFDRESEYFRRKLSPSTKGEDGSPDSPYIIHDVKVDEFAKFVWVWYNPYYSYSGKGKEHWLTILKLATEWEFQEIRNLATRQLERLHIDAVEKIAIYKEYKIKPELLLPSYMALCKKDKLPSPEEGKVLSMETVLKIACAREEMVLSALHSGLGCKSPSDAPDDVTKTIIAKLFELTLHLDDQPVGVGVEGQPTSNGLGKTLVDPEVITVKTPKKGSNVPNGAGGNPNGKAKPGAGTK